MAVIKIGDNFQLTRLDAFKYEYRAHQGIKAIIKGIIGFFVGRKVTLEEGQQLKPDLAPKETPSTELLNRSVEESAPADETQLTTGITPRDKPSSVSISETVQPTADGSINNESNVPAENLYSNPLEPEPHTPLNNSVSPHEKVIEDSIQASAKKISTDTKKTEHSQSESPDESGHIDEDPEKQIPLLVEDPDSLKTQPKPLDKEILVALGLSEDFLDQEETVIMDWLNSSDFMDKAAHPETATLVQYIIRRLGSRSSSRFLLPMKHENLDNAFKEHHQKLFEAPTPLNNSVSPHEKVIEDSFQASEEEISTDTKKTKRSQSESPDEFGHIDEDPEKQIPLLVEDPDSLKTQPKPLDKEILVALGLSEDFPDQEETVIMDWLNSNDFMDKAARPETATLVQYIIQRCVYQQKKSFFMDICGSLGSRASSKLHIPLHHENLFNAFVEHHQKLLSDDDQLSSKACRDIGMCLINELGSYLKEIEPPETKEKKDWPYVRWMDKNREKIEAPDENKLINFSHGGGRYHIERFLSGQANGYNLKGPNRYALSVDGGDTGIQVYTQFNPVGGLDHVEILYNEKANKHQIDKHSETSLRYLDLPARLTGKIPSKHLFAAEHAFEGGIKASSVRELVDTKITVFNSSLPPEA